MTVRMRRCAKTIQMTTRFPEMATVTKTVNAMDQSATCQGGWTTGFGRAAVEFGTTGLNGEPLFKTLRLPQTLSSVRQVSTLLFFMIEQCPGLYKIDMFQQVNKRQRRRPAEQGSNKDQ